MRVMLVGGTFDDDGGKPSKIVCTMRDALIANDQVSLIEFVNGGWFTDLGMIIADLDRFDVILWFANVPNDKPKLRNIKELYPKKYLVTSKRNFDEEYSFQHLINHALQLKSNLAVEIDRNTKGQFIGRVFDPLGAIWCDFTTDFALLVDKLIERMAFLMTITRKGTTYTDGVIQVPDEEEFFRIIKDRAAVFHKIVQPDAEVTRFLGNASFRCLRGFPSFRHGKLIYVSRRNVDKRFIDKDAFVPCYMDNSGQILYYGPNKPSVDTPIQMRLYNIFHRINYMLHSHVYVKGAPFTSRAIPCGGIQEVDEINKLFPVDIYQGAVNLIGHGSLVMASNLRFFNLIEYEGRKAPELMPEGIVYG